MTLPLNCKNITVWGPNGTGKSGVVDSVDFLLTGSITRLVGKGTKDITLKRHGIHIDSDSENAYVEATIILPNQDNEVLLTRRMSDPSTLEIVGCERELLDPIIDLAKRGQHVLSRREILTFITAEPNARATQIQNLLNIGEVEKIRKNLQSISNIFTKEVKSARAVLDKAKSTVASSTKISSYDEIKVLNFVNTNRVVLGAEEHKKIQYIDLRSGIERPGIINEDSANLVAIEKNLKFLSQDFSKVEGYKEIIHPFLLSLDQRVINEEDIKSLRYRKFYQEGIKFLEEDDLDICPLCETSWKNLELRSKLSNKEKFLEELEGRSKELINNAKKVKATINKIISFINKLAEPLKNRSEFSMINVELNSWIIRLNGFQEKLDDPIQEITWFFNNKLNIHCCFEPEKKQTLFDNINAKLKLAFPKARPDQVAWETLIALEENLKAVRSADTGYKLSIKKEKKANFLINQWTESRDSVLEKLYSQIEQKFTNLYRSLHGEDEATFTASLSPSKAALNFGVDFHGRGTHAPHALHSEGHQDSMGLCLFLALADYLAQGVIDIVLLDDVVMSVDSDHRRSLCSVLKQFFPHKQFIITTHDQTWANQLKTEGVTSSNTSFQFYNWSLEAGPQTNFQSSLWKDIDAKLEVGDVPGAAAKLRRGAEDFFESACDALEAKVTYRQNRRWELGQFMPPAFSKLKELLKKAKNSAHSWGDKSTSQEIGEIITIANQVWSRTQAEQWVVNSSVHYNEWAKLSVNDFTPIRESFEDLFGLFKCTSCDGTLKVVKNGLQVQALKCPCANTMFNLSPKK